MVHRPEQKSATGPIPRHPEKRDVILPLLKQYAMLGSLFVLLVLMVGFHYAYRGLHRFPTEYAPHVPVADAARGPELVQAYGCIGCHTIPGVPGATGRVGPRLDRLTEQTFVAGVLPNSPQHLAEWIMNPRQVDPRTAMPDLGVGEQDARDIAAYLYAVSK